jgi:hypothetical protein
MKKVACLFGNGGQIFEVLDVLSGNVVTTGERRDWGTDNNLLSRHGDHVIMYPRDFVGIWSSRSSMLIHCH